MHIYKNRVLAHGTLLINCNLKHLSAALKGETNRFQDKAIPSVKSRVINLSESSIGLDINILTTNFKSYLGDLYPLCAYTLPQSLTEKIKELALTKYSQRNWIFGYSPKYSYTNKFNYSESTIGYKIEVVKGIIEEIEFEKARQINANHKLSGKSLLGKEHNIYALATTLTFEGAEDFNQLLLESLF